MRHVKSKGGLNQEVKVHTYDKMWFQNSVPVSSIGSKTADQHSPLCPVSST